MGRINRLRRGALALMVLNLVMVGCASASSNMGKTIPMRGSHVAATTPESTAALLLPSRPCPRRPPQHTRSTGPGLGREMVPTGATSVLLCRYYGKPTEAWRLVASREIVAPDALESLRRRLNALPPSDPNKAYPCPKVTRYDTVVAAFGYSSSRVVDVSVDMSECKSASNGVRLSMYLPGARGARLVDELNKLVPLPAGTS